MTCIYRLPREAADRLATAAQGRKNAKAVHALATFLARFWSAPGRIGRAFPVDRVALADHPELGLTEARVRGALAVLEEIGFVERVEVAGSAYRATEHGLRRKPVQWRFGPDYMPVFLAANRRAQRARGAGSPARRPIMPPALPRPSAATPTKPERPPPRTPAPSAPQLARRDHPAEASFLIGEKGSAEAASGLEAALERLRRAGGF
ncbi:hypothetical protein M446_1146 [Methylobacterium sp. 4-46]|uniref:hypothetical protein n=1 Tax=unclassified Methylobacterium TaxID=2615210 RepID=UPI000152DB5C|nr:MULTISPECIES: hypothetical protein [Methylobacterium]ACA15672.1 hypothetical protein M446_1146 [Methylobacterium sp. 4-46]WFT81385.1 hypothetical protein QA634_05700 [Methylobacterium nodulans]